MHDFDEPDHHAAHVALAKKAHDDILDRHRRFDTLIESMTPNQLTAFAEMLDNFCHDGASIFYYKGVVGKVMTSKHGICPCGRDHADELLREVTEPIPAMPALFQPETPPEPVEIPPAPLAPTYSVKEIELLIKYNMKWTADGLFCKGCGIKYVSMEDRMVKPPGDCHGCEVKSKWG